jgi:hypothetical protein
MLNEQHSWLLTIVVTIDGGRLDVEDFAEHLMTDVQWALDHHANGYGVIPTSVGKRLE